MGISDIATDSEIPPPPPLPRHLVYECTSRPLKLIQFAKCCFIHIDTGRYYLCVIRALMQYLSFGGDCARLLFLHVDGTEGHCHRLL